MFLTMSLAVEKIDNVEDRWWRAVVLREVAGAFHAGMSRTPIARSYEVLAYRKQIGDCSAKTLADLYKDKLSEMSEDVSESFVDASVTVHNRALGIDSIRQLVQNAEEKFGVKTPFRSIYTMDMVIKRAETTPFIEWCVASIMHFLEEGSIRMSSLSQRELTGKGKGGKGELDLLVMQHKIAKQITNVWMERNAFTGEVVEICRNMTTDHTKYYELFGKPGDTTHDISWMTLLNVSAQKLLRLIEAWGAPIRSNKTKPIIKHKFELIQRRSS